MSTVGLDEKMWDVSSIKEFASIHDFSSLETFINARSLSHDYYYHYTTMEALEGIKKTKQLWLSDFRMANDLEEAKKCNKEINKYFYISFSTPIDKLENVPMWYLYNKGKGVRISISNTMIKAIKKNPELSIVDKDSRSRIMELTPENYDLSIFDIVYFHKFYSSNHAEIRTHNMSCYTLGYNEFEKYIDRNPFGVKDVCWSGEDESRILVTLHDEVRAKLDKNKNYVIAINMSDDFIENKMKITIGPECDKGLMERKGWQYSETSLSSKIRIPFWKESEAKECFVKKLLKSI